MARLGDVSLIAAEKIRPFLLPLLVVVAVFVARIAGLHSHVPLQNTGLESIAIGHSLATTGEFAHPFQVLDTGPTAHLAPAFPALVASVIRIFGDGTAGTYSLGWAVMVVVALQLSLLPALARQMGLGALTGLVAALCLLIGAYEKVFSEANYLGLLILLLAFPMYSIFHGPLSHRQIFGTAVLWGLALLVSPAALFVLFAWLLWVHRSTSTRGLHKLTLLLVPFVITAPWIIRNYTVFHRFSFIRDNFGMELALSYNPCASYSLDSLLKSGGSCPGFAHPNLDLGEAQVVRSLGEAEYNRRKLQVGLKEIEENPGRFFRLTSQRFAAFWFPPKSGEGEKDPYIGTLLMNAFTILSIPGLWILWKQNRDAAKFFLAWLVFFPPVYYLIVFSGRFRYPIAWATFMPGAYCLLKFLGGEWAPVQRQRNSKGFFESLGVQRIRKSEPDGAQHPHPARARQGQEIGDGENQV